jgi:hypothetical protein
MNPNRRMLLKAALFGAGGLGLRGLVSGLPAGLFAAPGRSAAEDTCNATAPQKLILVTSAAGDPLNANVPGCYVDGIYHPPSLGTGTVALGGASYTCGAPWAALPPAVLGRTCFFHHATYTPAHGDAAKVNALMGAIQRQEMLVSLLARNIAPCLGATQPQPLVLSDNLIRYAGAVLPVLNRSGLQRVLGAPTGSALTLRNLRDSDLDRLDALFKASGTPAQQAAVDRYRAAQAQARSVDPTLVSMLTSDADGGDARKTLNTAAVVLLKMNVSPAVVMTYDFGGDNHSDSQLQREAAATTASVAAIADLWDKLVAQGLQDGVTVVFQNVFGRTLNAAARGGNTDGRDHNGAHHCSVLIGKGFKGSVIGGVTPVGDDFGAQAIHSTTGAADAGGDVPFGDTLASVGKTIGAAVGVSRAVLDDQITKGKVVEAALAPLA